jgi:hypothetical protein
MTLAAKVAARYTQTNLEETARSVLSYTILNALAKVKLDRHLKSVVPITTTGSFSDGKELGENPEDMGQVDRPGHRPPTSIFVAWYLQTGLKKPSWASPGVVGNPR